MGSWYPSGLLGSGKLGGGCGPYLVSWRLQQQQQGSKGASRYASHRFHQGCHGLGRPAEHLVWGRSENCCVFAAMGSLQPYGCVVHDSFRTGAGLVSKFSSRSARLICAGRQWEQMISCRARDHLPSLSLMWLTIIWAPKSEGIESNPQQFTILTPLRAASSWCVCMIFLTQMYSPARQASQAQASGFSDPPGKLCAGTAGPAMRPSAAFTVYNSLE